MNMTLNFVVHKKLLHGGWVGGGGGGWGAIFTNRPLFSTISFTHTFIYQ